jgi:GMP synthase (glutamine-hydrolysing)
LKHIAIIDCAIQSPALPCFLKMKQQFKHSFTMHAPAHFGMSSILKDNPLGWIIFGSQSNVEDHLKWHLDLVLFIKQQLILNRPTLGICFGHQLMANAFGAEISKINSSTQVLQGKRDIHIVLDHYGLKKGENYSLFTSHKYEISKLSDQLMQVGTSSLCEFDVIAHKTLPFIGMQGHPESSASFIEVELGKSIGARPLKQVIDGGHHFLRQMFSHFFLSI